MNPTDCESHHYVLHTTIVIAKQHNSLIHNDTQLLAWGFYHSIVLFPQVFCAATASRPMHASSSIVFRRSLQMWGLWSTYLWVSGMVAVPYPGCMFQTNTSPPPFLLQSHCTKWVKPSRLARRCLSASPMKAATQIRWQSRQSSSNQWRERKSLHSFEWNVICDFQIAAIYSELNRVESVLG